MCTDIDYLPQLMMISKEDFILTKEYDRRSSWAPSISSTSSSTTPVTDSTNSSTWMERKVFSHIKRFFRRNSSSANSESALSSRRPSITVEEVITTTVNDESPEVNVPSSLPPSPASSSIPDEQLSPKTDCSHPLDPLYDYDFLLARCLKQHEHDRTELITRCQTPVTIPHADLIVGHSRSILINYKLYTRLCRALNRDPQLFQQYVNQYYACQSSINQREQLTFNSRTTKSTFDNVLKTFLHDYVTCLACQKAQTHLIKSTGLWRIECQLCGSQRSVKRLKWKR